MAYPTNAQFVAFVGDVEARALAPTVPLSALPDLVKIDEALARESATLDTYLSTRWPTPLNPVPEAVKTAVMILARESLDRQGRDFVIKAADRIRSWARDVSKGVATLGVAAGDATAPTPAADGGGVLIDAPARIFDDAGLAAFLGQN